MTTPFDIIGEQMNVIQEGLKKAEEETEGKWDDETCGYDTGASIREEESDVFPEPNY
jgi:hypothetical protein